MYVGCFLRIALIGAALEARRKTHLHLGVNAAVKCRIGVQVFVTTAQLEEIEHLIAKLLRRGT